MVRDRVNSPTFLHHNMLMTLTSMSWYQAWSIQMMHVAIQIYDRVHASHMITPWSIKQDHSWPWVRNRSSSCRCCAQLQWRPSKDDSNRCRPRIVGGAIDDAIAVRVSIDFHNTCHVQQQYQITNQLAGMGSFTVNVGARQSPNRNPRNTLISSLLTRHGLGALLVLVAFSTFQIFRQAAPSVSIWERQLNHNCTHDLTL